MSPVKIVKCNRDNIFSLNKCETNEINTTENEATCKENANKKNTQSQIFNIINNANFNSIKNTTNKITINQNMSNYIHLNSNSNNL